MGPDQDGHDDESEEVLAGGVANAGAVTRVGPHVLRPANPHTASIHRFLRGLRAAGFDGASEPVGVDPDGRERLVHIDGDVAVPPYPAWVQTDEALASIARLLRRCHDAARHVDTTGSTWSDEMADPRGGPVVGHNDVCLENVVCRRGRAVGLLDWDFAAPGRPMWDLGQMARMCVPVDDDANAARLGWAPADRPARLRAVADAYGCTAAERAELVEVLDHAMATGGEFVRRRVEAGEAAFMAMWDDMGGMARYDRRRAWWDEHRPAFVAAMG